jgi:hypothetical protein
MYKINTDLKKFIFSYLRKKPKKICISCNKVCVWHNKICDYLSYPLLDNSIWVTECKSCLTKNQVTSVYT